MVYPAPARNWQPVLTIIEGLILLAIVGLWTNTFDLAKSSIQLQTQVVGLRADLSDLRSQLAAVPTLSRSISHDEAVLDEHERRITILEQLRHFR